MLKSPPAAKLNVSLHICIMHAAQVSGPVALQLCAVLLWDEAMPFSQCVQALAVGTDSQSSQPAFVPPSSFPFTRVDSSLWRRPPPWQLCLCRALLVQPRIPLPPNPCSARTFPQNPKPCEWESAFVSGIFHPDPSNFPTVECNKNANDGLPGIRESLCGNRRGWRRVRVEKKNGQQAVGFARCLAHVWAPGSDHQSHAGLARCREKRKKKATCLSWRLFSATLFAVSQDFSATVQIINWSNWLVRRAQALAESAPPRLQAGRCALIGRPWAGTVRQRFASRCNSSHASSVRDSWGSVFLYF